MGRCLFDGPFANPGNNLRMMKLMTQNARKKYIKRLKKEDPEGYEEFCEYYAEELKGLL